MKGKYKVIVRNNKLHYEFEIKRNITIIQGDSATGKTTLINMLRQAENLGESSRSGCAVKCSMQNSGGCQLEINLAEHSGDNIFYRRRNAFINTEEFAAEVRGSDNYFCIDHQRKSL